MRKTFSAALGALLLLSATLAHAQKVVTVDGSLTEIAVALGAADRLVGVDTTSAWIPEVSELPDVGYMRMLSVEGLLSLTPDTILVTSDAGPLSVLEQVSQAGVDLEIIENDYTLAGVLNKVSAVADQLQLPAKGESLKKSIAADFNDIEQRIAQYPKPYRVLFIMDSGERGFMVAGNGTRAEGILKMAGLQNAFNNIPGYKPLTPEAAIMANPDVILVFHSQTPLEKIKQNPAIQYTEAVQHDRIYNVDHLNLLNFGSSVGQSILALQEWLLRQ
ncbi:heme/hemin ABC transporter substrate-binding protein [Gynuella sunshinyii]|uniref:ABC-type hemin transport system, periplasmic component n=1 Tax=Gynuella sunshinyii YC6258 TaxID=1445510 RepID=A0A0C5VNE5_9GAMM|nr:ABC transporter substrate-binding protein [Gynuella sunshinyii]AJQ94908.1 ABC-type hemin transport system, periplasmic component [Gynuella sunshinyii YC6258]